jgi:hypothetical protein
MDTPLCENLKQQQTLHQRGGRNGRWRGPSFRPLCVFCVCQAFPRPTPLSIVATMTGGTSSLRPSIHPSLIQQQYATATGTTSKTKSTHKPQHHHLNLDVNVLDLVVSHVLTIATRSQTPARTVRGVPPRNKTRASSPQAENSDATTRHTRTHQQRPHRITKAPVETNVVPS